MRAALLLAAIAATMAAAPIETFTSFTDWSAAAGGPPAIANTSQTVRLVYQQNQAAFGSGPMRAAGIHVDTTPASWGTGLEFFLRFSDGTEQSAGWFGGSGQFVIGFFGFTSPQPFTALIVRTGPPWWTGGTAETVTLSDFASVVNPPDNRTPSETPEPAGWALGALGAGLIAGRMLRRGSR